MDNLTSLIYGSAGEDETTAMYDESDNYENIIDSNRYDAPKEKLEIFRESAVKRLLKSKFVTGQSSD